jgi:hypothetical protein
MTESSVPAWDWGGGVGNKCKSLADADGVSCKWNPTYNLKMNNLYGNKNVMCTDDSKDEANKYVYIGAVNWAAYLKDVATVGGSISTEATRKA